MTSSENEAKSNVRLTQIPEFGMGYLENDFACGG